MANHNIMAEARIEKKGPNRNVFTCVVFLLT